MGWYAAELERVRLLLYQDPQVRGIGYGQYEDEGADEDNSYGKNEA